MNLYFINSFSFTKFVKRKIEIIINYITCVLFFDDASI